MISQLIFRRFNNTSTIECKYYDLNTDCTNIFKIKSSMFESYKDIINEMKGNHSSTTNCSKDICKNFVNNPIRFSTNFKSSYQNTNVTNIPVLPFYMDDNNQTVPIIIPDTDKNFEFQALSFLCEKRNMSWAPLKNGILQFKRKSVWELSAMELGVVYLDCVHDEFEFSINPCRLKGDSEIYSYYDNTTVHFLCSNKNTFQKSSRKF